MLFSGANVRIFCGKRNFLRKIRGYAAFGRTGGESKKIIWDVGIINMT